MLHHRRVGVLHSLASLVTLKTDIKKKIRYAPFCTSSQKRCLFKRYKRLSALNARDVYDRSRFYYTFLL